MLKRTRPSAILERPGRTHACSEHVPLHIALWVERSCTHVQAAANWPELQESVARLCVAWWQADAPGKEALVTQTIPYLLVRALSTCEDHPSHRLPCVDTST